MSSSSAPKLSAYVLTRNSGRMLAEVLAPVYRVADEIVVLDSGSSDATLEIARVYGCRVERRAFDNFAAQRQAAQDLCSHDHVLFVDSDEVMSDALVDAVLQVKRQGFPGHVYAFRREWYVMGRKVRGLYPVNSPDYPIRLLDRRKSDFCNSSIVHESPSNSDDPVVLDRPLSHFTFPTKAEFNKKLAFYSSLHADTVLGWNKPVPSRTNAAVRAVSAFCKWYFMKRLVLDGRAGFHCARYAARYTYLKYEHARQAHGRGDRDGRTITKIMGIVMGMVAI
ncbi:MULTISPECIES: glycosyltransferase family 2 protein [Phyllobacteriaceae]|nr:MULTISPECIES: glycosyltransferase family 2 protein [Mesorhizobium]MBN9234946.1 glycosyltransferase family 2 protein [Mesorhizobium sp.]MDQ0330729.1 glycosyltransferase involved in cell wall biosynthesis [Mesorhizobium sp. YL-MeA3-2017]